jgi:hypothetical protein
MENGCLARMSLIGMRGRPRTVPGVPLKGLMLHIISELKTPVGIDLKMVPLEYEAELPIAMVSCLYSHTSVA